MAANENIELLAAKLKPIIVGWLPRHAVNSSAAGDVTVGTHALNSSFHTGTLGRSQAPWVAEDIDTDIATHTALPNAHHAQSHVLATNVGLGADHTVSGLTAGQYLRATAANAAAFAAILDADLPNTIVRTSRQVIAGSGLTGGGNLGADVTLNVGAGALISVAADSVALASGTAQYQVPVTGANPYTPGWTALSGFAGDGLEFASGVFNVLAGDGLITAADYVAIDLSATSGLELTGTTPSKTLQIADAIAGAGLTIASKVLAVGAGSLITVAADSVGVTPGSAQYQIPITGTTPFAPAWTGLSTLAGSGLTFGSGVFAVGAGTLITVNADDVALSNGSAQYQIPMTGTTPFTPAWTGLGTLAGDGIAFGTNFAIELSATSGLELTGSSPAKTLQLADTVAGAGLTIASKVLAVGAGTLITVAADTVGLSVGSAQYQVPVTGANPYTPGWTDLSTFAGDGLTFSTGTFNVGAGALITVAANTVGVSNGTAQYQVPVTGATPFAPDWVALSTMAGTGLSFAGGVFAVNAGDGLVFATDDLALELSVTSGLELAGTSPNKTLQLADTIAGAGLTIASKVLAVGAGNGITVAADTVALTTPGTLTVSTVSSSVGSHVHTITSSSMPGAAASLLASDATGKLTLPLMVASTSLTTPLVLSGTGVSLTLQPNLDLILDPDSNITRMGSGVSIQASVQATWATGWRITDIGEADFRYLSVDEMHAKSFIADLEQALAGGQIIAKSVTSLGADFVLPVAGATGSLVVKDLPSAPNMQVFEAGDFVGLRQFSRAGGSLTIGWAWGTVTAYVDGSGANEGTQSWTFTRHATTPGLASGTIFKDAIILDFGVTGNGYYEVNAIDGLYGLNSPYAQIVTWATHPATQTVRTRFGNLRGITSQANEFGIFAGSGTAVTDRYIRASSYAMELRNVPLNLYDGSAMTMQLSAGTNNNSPYMALGSPLPTAPLVNNGIWLGLDSAAYKFRVGNVNTGALTSGMYWDGSVLLIGSATAENLYATGSAVQMRVGSTVHAQLASSTLTLGVTANGDYITIDGTNGVRLYANSALLGQWTAAGGVVIGSVANSTSRVEIASGAINMISKSGTGVDTTFVNMSIAGVLTLGDTLNENVVIDTTGVALKDGASVYGKFAATTTLGVTSGTHVSITSTALQIKDSGTVYTNLTSGALTLGNTAAKHTILDGSGIALNDATVTYGKFAATTTLGVTTGKHVSITSTLLEFKDNTTVYASLSGTAWTLGTAAGNNILIDSSGVSLKNNATVYGIFAATTTLGVSTTKHIDIASTYIRLIDNTTTYVDLTGTTLTMGATGGRHVILDTNGVTLKDNTTTYGVFAATTTIGATSSKHVSVSSSALQLKDGGSVYTELSGTTLTLGLTSSGDYISIDGTNGLKLYSNAVLLGQWTGAGGVVIGEDANSKSRVTIASGAVSLISKSAGGVDATLINLSAAGVLRIGEYADGKSRVEINAGAVSIIYRTAGADTTKISLDASGNASFAGNITSTSGAIGGFTIGATSLTAGSGATTVGMDAGGTNPAFYAGSATPGSAPFRVTNAGALTSTSGSIGGWTIGATLSATNLVLTPGAANVANILAGTGATAGGINAANASGDIVFWAGSTYANRASAPFRVTAGGAFTGTTGTVAGDFSVTGSGKLIAGGGQTIIDAGGLELGTYPNLDTSSLPGDGARSISFWTDPAVASGTPRARMYAASDNVGAPYWSVVITPGATGSNPALTLWRETDATSSLWLSNIDSVVGIPGASFNASGVQVTGALSMEGTITAKNHVLPFADATYDLGSGGGTPKRWRVIYADSIVVTSGVSGGTLSGAEWEFAGSMTIDANSAANTTVSIVNQNASYTASLDVEGNITLGGTVDGVDVAGLKSGYDAHVADIAAHGATGAVVGTTNTQTLSGKTLTLPKINDTSANNVYIFGVSELTADRTITLPLLAANDVFVFADFAQTLTNKTLTTPTIGNFTNAQHAHTNAASGGTIAHGSLTGITADQHHAQSHVLATTTALGTDHTVSGLTAGQYLRATAATTAAFQTIADADLPATIVRTSRSIVAGAGLTGGGDLSADRTLAVGAGLGITVNADDVALTTPGTLTATSTNSSTGSHTHAITSSSNPGAAVAILASDASGYLRLVRLGIGAAPTAAISLVASTAATGGIDFGTDVNLYRSAANVLKTDDTFNAVAGLQKNGIDAIAYGDMVFNAEPWLSGFTLVMPELWNQLFRADLRYTVTQTGFTTFTASQIFVASESGQRIDAGNTGVITIDLISKGEYGANGIVYPQGYIYVHCYLSSPPYSLFNAVSGRVKDKDNVWRAMTSAARIGATNTWRLTVPSNIYAVTLEISIEAHLVDGSYLSSIEYFPQRPAGAKWAIPNKYGAERLYSTWDWRDSNNAVTASINATGVITGTGLIAPYMRPAANSTTALQLQKSDGTAVVTIDTTNSRVGLGITPVDARLDVADSTNALRLRAGNGSAVFTANQIIFSYAAGASYSHAIKSRHASGASTGNALDFYLWNYGVDAAATIGTKHILTLDGTGNVGIGTTSPSKLLDVSAGSGYGGLTVTSGSLQRITMGYEAGVTANVTPVQIWADSLGNLGLSSRTNYASNILFFTTPSATPTASIERVRINAEGRVGIGTQSPNAALEIVATAANKGLRLTSSGGSAYYWSIDPVYNYSNPDLIFSVNGTEAARFNASGYFGIGGGNPAYRLDVTGSGRFTDDLTVNDYLDVDGAATVGGIFTVGTVFRVNTAGTRVGINRDADQQFDLDVAGSIRGQYIVGKHAIQLSSAVGVYHFDGSAPYNLDFTGTNVSHVGIGGTETGGVIYRPGKYGKAVQLAEATTNLVANPSLETGASGWAVYAGLTSVAASTESAMYGAQSLKCVCSGSGTPRAYTSVSGLTLLGTYTVSVYINRVSGSGTPYLYFKAMIGGAEATQFSAAGTNIDGWQRITYTATLTGLEDGFRVTPGVNSGASGDVFYIDAVQVEARSYATAYCDGSLGSGHSWSGTEHASSSSRVATTLKYSSNQVNANIGTIMMWVKVDGYNSVGGGLWGWGSSNGIMDAYIASNGALNCRVGGISVLSLGGFGVNTWRHLVWTWNAAASEYKLFVDGIQYGSTISYATQPKHADFSIGGISALSSAYTHNGLIDEVVLLDYVADPKLIRSIYESDAPVFVESSVFHWRSPSRVPVWVDEYGFWAQGVSGGEILGLYGGDPRNPTGNVTKSWGGVTMEENDVVIGRTTSGAALHWDDSVRQLILGTQSGSHLLTTSTAMQFRNSTTVLSEWTGSTITLGATAGEHVAISGTAVQIKDGLTNVYTDLTAGVLTLGLVSGGEYVSLDGTYGLRLYGGNVLLGQWTAAGGVIIGEVANSKSRVEIAAGAISFINRSGAGADTTVISLLANGSATFAGSITSTTGTIGGFTIGATSLTVGSGATKVGIDAGGTNPAFYAGSDTPGSAPFRVTNAGALTATSGTVGGWTLNTAAIFKETGVDATSAGMAPADYPFYAGKQYAGRASAPFRVTNAGVLSATSATISGAITATSGSITGDFSIGASGRFYSGAAVTWQSAGYQLEYNSGTPRLYVGDGGVLVTDKYIMWDGTNLEWRGVNTSLTAAGAFTASNATITGVITANTGYIGGATGWVIAANKLSSTNIELNSGAVNVANITVGTGATAAGLNAASSTATDIAFWAGNTHALRAVVGTPFRVQIDGKLFATNADITGVITANTGYIGGTGGWTIAANKLSSTNIALYSSATAATARLELGDGTTANLTAGVVAPGVTGDVVFWAGSTHANRATAPFRVTAGGALTATTGTIAGDFSISGSGRILASGGNVALTANGVNIGLYTGVNGGVAPANESMALAWYDTPATPTGLQARVYVGKDNTNYPHWNVTVNGASPMTMTLWNSTLRYLWFTNVQSVVGFPGINTITSSTVNITGNLTMEGTITAKNHVLPHADVTYNLGSGSYQWGTIYANSIVLTGGISGGTLGGAEWEFAGSMIIDANSGGATTVTITNQGAGTASLNVEDNITLGGTVDGVDIAGWKSSYDLHVADTNIHHNKSHVLATTSVLGGDHTVSGLTTGTYLRATAANAAAFQLIPDADLPSTIVRTSRQVIAGNGLTGGGALTGDVTLTVGTPGSSTASSTNAVTSTSHTHAIDSTIARSAISLTAGTGLTGGGDLTANRTFAVGAGTMITVNTDDVALSNGSAQYQIPVTGATPFTPVWTLMSTFTGAGLTFGSNVFTVGAGLGITVNANDVALTTPGSLSATSTNSSTGNHTHAVDSTIARSAISLTAGNGLTGGGDLTANRTFAVGAGLGITVNTDDVALTTPGTLTVSSANSSTGSHTHAITSSSNPLANARILATDASGYLQLVRLGLGMAAATHRLEVQDGILVDRDGSDSYIVFARTATNVAQIRGTTLGLNITNGAGSGSILVVDTTNNYVGVNTATPTYPLHVTGSGKFTGSVDVNVQFLGQAADTVSAPSFSWTTDTNTGFYQPAADNIGFVVGGAEKVRIDSVGFFGIGTATPLAPLHVEQAVEASFTGTAKGGIHLDTTTDADNNYRSISFGRANDVVARIATKRTSTGSLLYFGTSNSYAGGVTNSGIIIDQTGRVAIGGASVPSYTLDVAGGARVTGDLNVDGGTINLSASGIIDFGTNTIAEDGTYLQFTGAKPIYHGQTVQAASWSITTAGVATLASITAAANLTLNPSGDIILDPAGNDVLPNSNYDISLGSISKKFLTLHAAELWVETLVAQETIATIGGRVLVGQSSSLTSDIAPAATTIYLKHNNFRSGDVGYMEANGQLEFITFTSNPSGTGPYTYTVTRNVDGTGAGTWYAGDVVFNTGTTGNGFIDMYSLWSVKGRNLTGVFNWSGSAYSVNYADNASWSVFGDGANNAVNDAVYFGLSGTTWNNLFFNLVTAGVYVATLVWEYWNGAAWTAFTPTATTDFKSTGSKSVTWSTLASWAATDINSVTAYWVRCRISAWTSWTTLPVQGDRKVRGVEKQYGPTIVGNVRNSTTWNDFTERWAIGNLDGLYDYGSDQYGVAFGKESATWLAMDDATGLRIMNNTTTLGSWDASGNITVGDAAGENVYVTSAGVYLRSGTTAYTSLVGTTLTLGYNIAGGEYVTIDATSGVCLYGAGTLLGNWTAAGGIVIGDNTNNDKSRIEITSGALNFITDIGGTDSTRVSISTAGKVTVGVATGNHIEITSTTFDIMYNTTPKISMDSSGNASFSGAIAVGSTLTIGTAGAIVTTGVTYASGTGVFLGYDSTAYKFRVGTAAGNRVVWDGTDFFWQGVNTSLTKAGLFTADDADIAGVITAETGYIGGTSGWVIASKKITSSNIGIYAGTANLEAKIEVGTGTTAYTAGINSANATGQIAFWAGATWINRAAAPFRVTIDGGLTSTSGKIGDWTIAASSLSATNLVLTSGAAGTANIRVGDGSTPSITAGINSPASATEIAFWAGQTFASKTTAPFRVTAAGIATMTGATLLGSAMGVTLYPTFALKFEGPMAGNGVNVNSFDGRQGVASGSIIGVAGKFGKAYQMAPANTNLVQNPSIEVDTTGYTANVSGSTLTRDGTSYKFGVYSLRTVCDGVSANQGWYYNIPNAVTASTWYSGGVWLRSVTGATITLALINQSGGATFATTSITLTNIWTWYRVSGQTPVGCTAARIAVYQPAAASLVFYTDGVQFETGQFSTPYADGSLGIGHAWAGTAHASNSTRAGLSYLVYGGARDWLPERIGALSVWFYPIKRVGGSYQTIFRYDGSTGYVMLRINDSGDTVASYWGTTSSNTSNTVTYDTWNHIAMTINGSTKIMYLNGVKTTGSVGSNFSLSASGNASVGYSTAGDQFMGYVDDLFIMPYVLSDQEVQQLYQSNLPANIASGSGELKLSSSTTQAAIIGSSQGIVAYSDTGAESFALANESFNWGAQYVSGSILSAGDFVLGDPDARHLFYDASAGTLSIKSNTVERIGLSATGVLTIKDSSGNAKISLDASGNASFAGAITVDTSLTVGSTGKIITSGVTNVSTGAGVFLGYESSQYQFRVGNPSGDKLLWNGTNLVITGSIDLPTVDIDSNGIRVQTDPVNFLNAHSYRFENGGVNVGGLYAFQNASLTNVTVSSNCTPGGDAVAVNTDALGVITVVSKGDAKTAQIYLEAIGKKTDGTSAQTASLTIVGKPSTAGGTSATLTAGTIGLTGNTTVTGTLNVTSTLTRNGNTVWDAGNDGSGTGLNADLLDGLHDTSFLRMDANNVGTDTDLYYGLGKAKIGYAGFADSATFAHVDQHTTTGYALSQTAAGDTFLNAKTGNKIYLRNNDNAIGNIDNDGIHLGTGKYIDSLVPYKRNGTDGYLFVPLHVAGLTDNNGQVWAQSGTDFPLSGNVYFNMGATANGTVPDAAKAVVIFAKAKWTEVVNSYYLAFRARGGSVNDMLLYPHAVDQYATIQGIVWLDATNHDFEMINGSSVKFVDDISITLIGYFI